MSLESMTVRISPCLTDGAGTVHSFIADIDLQVENVSLQEIRKIEDGIHRIFTPTECGCIR